ncbi:MAG: PRC-barrel domain-containing protein [Thermoplasmata archaeon]
MLTEISELMGMEVYTDKGIALGNVDDLIVETDNQKIDGLFIGNPNPLLVEHSKPVSVPFRWIGNVGDIIILKYFPKFVQTGASPDRVPKVRKLAEEVKQFAHAAEEKFMHAEHAAAEKLKGGSKLADEIQEI